MEQDLATYCLTGRPGGFEITRRARSLARFPAGARILDLGCGAGETVDHLRKKYRLDAVGIDKKHDLHDKCKGRITGTAEKLPFPSVSLDGILMECSFSLMEERSKVLPECRRVLKPGGRLIISDMYARGEPAVFQGFLGNLDKKETLVSLLEEHLFTVDHFEDLSPLLNEMWGQMIFDQGADAFYGNLKVDRDALKRVRCGYFLLLATPKEDRAK